MKNRFQQEDVRKVLTVARWVICLNASVSIKEQEAISNANTEIRKY